MNSLDEGEGHRVLQSEHPAANEKGLDGQVESFGLEKATFRFIRDLSSQQTPALARSVALDLFDERRIDDFIGIDCFCLGELIGHHIESDPNGIGGGIGDFLDFGAEVTIGLCENIVAGATKIFFHHRHADFFVGFEYLDALRERSEKSYRRVGILFYVGDAIKDIFPQYAKECSLTR